MPLAAAVAGSGSAGLAAAAAAATAPPPQTLSPLLDNPDQRLSQDTDRLTTNLGELIAAAVTLPGRIVYYSIALAHLFGWFAPALCLAYFLLGSLPNWMLLHRVVPALVEQERLEGEFRHTHAEIRMLAESAAFSGGTLADRARASRVFRSVVRNQHRVLLRQLPLNVATQIFDYVGSVANYGILGWGVLWLSSARSMTPSQIAGMLASGSYACMYLINSFTSIFDLTTFAADVAAYGKRVQEVLEFGEDRCGRSGRDEMGRGRERKGSHGRPSSTGTEDSDGDGPRFGFDIGCGSATATATATLCAPGFQSNPDADGGVAEGILVGAGVDSVPDAGGANARADASTLLLCADHVTLRAPPSLSHPKGRVLVRDLSFRVTRGKHVMIKGESGVGKSTLLRAIAGLGGMRVPGLDLCLPGGASASASASASAAHDVAFLPQQPIMFTGTLEELLCYPSTVTAAKSRYNGGARQDSSQPVVCSPHLRRQLEELVGLLDLKSILGLAGWNDASFDWSTLSPGEKQRVALIRLLVSADIPVGAPRLAVLDEAFTALDPSMMAFCLRMLQDRLATAGTTLVFVSHLDRRLERFVEGRTIVLERDGEPRVAQPQ